MIIRDFTLNLSVGAMVDSIVESVTHQVSDNDVVSKLDVKKEVKETEGFSGVFKSLTSLGIVAIVLVLVVIIAGPLAVFFVMRALKSSVF